MDENRETDRLLDFDQEDVQNSLIVAMTKAMQGDPLPATVSETDLSDFKATIHELVKKIQELMDALAQAVTEAVKATPPLTKATNRQRWRTCKHLAADTRHKVTMPMAKRQIKRPRNREYRQRRSER